MCVHLCRFDQTEDTCQTWEHGLSPLFAAGSSGRIQTGSRSGELHCRWLRQTHRRNYKQSKSLRRYPKGFCVKWDFIYLSIYLYLSVCPSVHISFSLPPPPTSFLSLFPLLFSSFLSLPFFISSLISVSLYLSFLSFSLPLPVFLSLPFFLPLSLSFFLSFLFSLYLHSLPLSVPFFPSFFSISLNV